MARPCSEGLTGSLCPRLSDGPSVRGPQCVAGPAHSPSPTRLPLDRPPASQVKVEALASHRLGHSGQSSLKTVPGLVPKPHGDQPVLSTQQVAPDATWVGGSQYPQPQPLQDQHATSPRGQAPAVLASLQAPGNAPHGQKGGRGSPTRRLFILRRHQRMSQT